jgi:hypothetical protein
MDILAHGLWAGIGMAWLARRRPITRRDGVAAVALAVAPDLVQLLPLLWAAATGSGPQVLLDYVRARPGGEPAMPPGVALWAHHLHCVMHSALVAGAVTAIVWRWRGAMWWPLLGWWSHIVIDVFTHSADFYPSPVLYPITQRGFDGVAWNTPWFAAVNYTALALALLALAWSARRRRRGPG